MWLTQKNTQAKKDGRVCSATNELLVFSVDMLVNWAIVERFVVLSASNYVTVERLLSFLIRTVSPRWRNNDVLGCRLEKRCEEAIGQAVGRFKEDAEGSEREILEVLGPMMGDQLGALSVRPHWVRSTIPAI